MSEVRHFSDMTSIEIKRLNDKCIEAAMEYTSSIGIGGLSELGSHNVYKSIEDATLGEWARAIRIKNKRIFADLNTEANK